MKNKKTGRKTETYFEITTKKKKEIILDIVAKESNSNIIKTFRQKNHIPEDGLPACYGWKFAHLIEFGGKEIGNLAGLEAICKQICDGEKIRTKSEANEIKYLLSYYIVFGEQGLDMHLYESQDIIFGFYKEKADSFYLSNIFLKAENFNKDYPLCIRFRPNVNQRDLINFIKDNYQNILKEQTYLIGKKRRIRKKTRRNYKKK